MFSSFKLKKRKRILFAAAAVILIFIICFTAAARKRKIRAASSADTMHTLAIDPGHGGMDGGALSEDGSKESDINLAIALRLRAIAEFCGKDNILIRQDDSTKCDTPNYSEHRDLECRTELVQRVSNPVYIGIHQNCFPTGQPSGAQVIYSDKDGSEILGKITLGNLIKSLDPMNRRVAEPMDKKLYILSHLECPAILVECGFMSNFSDIQKLKTPEYQTALASVLMGSYIQFLNNTLCI